MVGAGGMASPGSSPLPTGPTGERRPPLPQPYVSARRAVKAWRALGASRWVIRTLCEGAQIPWRSAPSRHRARPFALADKDVDFAREEIEKNLASGFWKELHGAEIDEAVVIMNGFVTWSAGKQRFVLDCRHTNGFIEDRAFKYEGLLDLAPQLVPGDHLISWDIRKAYHHILLAEKDRPYFCFQCMGRVFMSLTMPFGLKTAPFIWTKVCRPVVQRLRAMDFRVIAYVDDFGGGPPTRHPSQAATKAEAAAGSRKVRDLFYRLGLHVHPDKGVAAGTTCLPLLGFHLDTVRRLIVVSPDRVRKVMGMAARLARHAAKHRRWVPFATLRSFAGTAVSTTLAVPAARFRLRSVYTALAEHTVGPRTRLGKRALLDIKWWAALTTNASNGRALWPPAPHATMHTDASNTGWGATWNQLVPARGYHTAARKHMHINLLELGAVRLGLLSFVDFLKRPETVLRLVTDSQVVMHVVNSGSSRSKAVMAELRRLREVCEAHGVTIRAEYLPSALNLWADALSRSNDSTDWSLRQATFLELDAEFGPHTVDLCATPENAKCGRFYTKLAAPGSGGVDALRQDWAGENGWCNPPFNLVGPVVTKIIQTGAAVTLVAPRWEAQPWWGLALRHCDTMRELAPADGVFTHGSYANPAAPLKWRVVVFRFNGRAATPSPA